MNKVLIALFILASPGLSFAGTYEACQSFSALAGAGAKARDSGKPQSEHFAEVIELLKKYRGSENEEQREFLIGLAMVAYQVPDQSRASIEREVFATCLEIK